MESVIPLSVLDLSPVPERSDAGRGAAIRPCPRIILVDKAAAGLESEPAQVAREHGAAVLVVTHDERIFPRFDRLVSLCDGRIETEQAGRPAAA
jgi:ABC-type ATPase involved in cell division